ncbi:MAG TPA: ferrochelatase [Nitrospira sp.]|nr:ferrochelatase [Nitrospira sp.]
MASSRKVTAILLMIMGGPDCLEHVEPFLLDVRGGRPTPPELVEEIRARYRATGGKSPAVGITRALARKLERRLNESGQGRFRVHVGLRHWHPFIQEAYADLLSEEPEQVIALCLAPQQSSLSTGAYRKKVEEARAALQSRCPVAYVGSWNRHPMLIAAFVEQIRKGLQAFPAEVRSHVPVLFTAHSLPQRIVAMNDPYPEEVRATVLAIEACFANRPTKFAYQSQGRSSEPWLGPTVESAIEELRREGRQQVLVAPIGFLCDHVETLYDIDIELKQFAARLGLHLERMPMLNDSDSLVDTLADVLAAQDSSLAVTQ